MITGPRFKRALERELRCNVMYKYTDAAGTTVPEYAATHIKVRCFYFTMSPTLIAPLAAKIAAMPGCVATEQITTHKTLRPQAIAVFDRSLA